MATTKPPHDRARKRVRTAVSYPVSRVPFQLKEQSFPRFLVIESTDSQCPLRKASPFVVAKELEAVLGGKCKATKMSSGGILIECENKAQADAVFAMQRLANLTIKVSAHRSLNSCQGVISDPDLADLTEDEILEGLQEENVTAVRRIMIRRNDIDIPTNHLVLTFNSTKLPESLKLGYVVHRVRPYIPNPRRCFKCQRFGHTLQSCRGKETCAKCASTDHHAISCAAQEVKCVNCAGPHPAYSRKCQKFQNEKEIMSIKVKEGLSIQEARRRFSFVQKGTFAEVARRGAGPPRASVGTQFSSADLALAQSPPVQQPAQPQPTARAPAPEAVQPPALSAPAEEAMDVVPSTSSLSGPQRGTGRHSTSLLPVPSKGTGKNASKTPARSEPPARKPPDKK